MTTITVLPESDDNHPAIQFDPDNTIADIDPMIYGGFTEYVLRGRRKPKKKEEKDLNYEDGVNKI